jgi:hypothetical protein
MGNDRVKLHIGVGVTVSSSSLTELAKWLEEKGMAEEAEIKVDPGNARTGAQTEYTASFRLSAPRVASSYVSGEAEAQRAETERIVDALLGMKPQRRGRNG